MRPYSPPHHMAHGKFLSSLVSEDLPGRRIKLRRALIYRTADGERIVVPKGFECDQTSDLLARRGDWDIASVIHDFLYWEGKRSRREADAIYREAMDALEVNALVKWTFWLGVRGFAWNAWRKHRAVTN